MIDDDAVSGFPALDGLLADVADADVLHPVARGTNHAGCGGDDGKAALHGRVIGSADVRRHIAILAEPPAGVVHSLRAGVVIEVLLDGTDLRHVAIDQHLEGRAPRLRRRYGGWMDTDSRHQTKEKPGHSRRTTSECSAR
jgi:hypothetical protein